MKKMNEKMIEKMINLLANGGEAVFTSKVKATVDDGALLVTIRSEFSDEATEICYDSATEEDVPEIVEEIDHAVLAGA